MSSDDILLGLGLVLVLAVAAQLVARLTRLPAIVVLLPAGFVAGAVTDVVHPDKLLGDLFQPFVSIAVGVILFEAGLRLSFAAIAPGARSLVVRLITLGVLVTWLGVGAAAALLIGGLDTQGCAADRRGPRGLGPDGRAAAALVRAPAARGAVTAHVGGRARRSDRRAAGGAGLPRRRHRPSVAPGRDAAEHRRRTARRGRGHRGAAVPPRRGAATGAARRRCR